MAMAGMAIVIVTDVLHRLVMPFLFFLHALLVSFLIPILAVLMADGADSTVVALLLLLHAMAVGVAAAICILLMGISDSVSSGHQGTGCTYGKGTQRLCTDPERYHEHNPRLHRRSDDP